MIRGRTPKSRKRSIVAAVLGVLLIVGSAPATVSADEYDAQRAGHPMRVLGYILHPIGVILDTLIMRPAHFLVSHEPFKTIFGHTDYGDTH